MEKERIIVIFDFLDYVEVETRKEAIEIVKKYAGKGKKIFVVKEEIDWEDQQEEKKYKENTEKGQNDSCPRYDIFD